MFTTEDAQLLRTLQRKTLAVLEEEIGRSADVALLDVPSQRNVGDALIFLGELNYLRKLGARVRYVADMWSLDPSTLRKKMPSGVILLHGGGNLGDIWLGHEEYRERVVTEFSEYRVVQLPQSISFNSKEREASANHILGKHGNFTVLVRDRDSLDRLERGLPSLSGRYCWDLALGSKLPEHGTPAAHPAVAIARTDAEASSGLSAIDGSSWLPGIPTLLRDWPELAEADRTWSRARRSSIVYSGFSRAFAASGLSVPGRLQRAAQTALLRVNTSAVAVGTHFVGSGKIAIVDRLHAHVLACMLGVPHVLLDNSYGKLSAPYREYTHGFSTAHMAGCLDEARELAFRLKDTR